ncbi:MAG TPA: dethiobiotin synthase [Pusillimonas sp.]|uniref:dethiobiotin synthase n=1 Tax=Pusillimonas sp. TaxID=3040095 RepID=UPI002CA34D13|nr:dethiobiotin synthase [Pusillimonas sp.]HUH86424.1 dethiobiotin synthase [Pusillimonas sp.]
MSTASHFSCFITGTDTEIGKTLISSAMLHALVQQGVKAAGMKPVAAGAEQRDGVWHNEDVDSLNAAGNVSLAPELVTPYLWREPIAPHIAAQQSGVQMFSSRILQAYAQIGQACDAVVVEGVGGFCVPLSDYLDTADLARELGLPVVMVVGLRLGCINHALLTVQAIAAQGLELVGWVANTVDAKMPYMQENIDALRRRLSAPLLGHVPRLQPATCQAAAEHIDFTLLPGWPRGDHQGGSVQPGPLDAA